jgi:hypothetical protein
MSASAYLARADALTTKLLALLDVKPSIDPVAVEHARVELAAVQQLVTLEQMKELHKVAMERECKGLHNVEFERELLELKKAQLSHPSSTSVSTTAAAAASGTPLRPTRRTRSRSSGVHTPPPPLSLDQDDNSAASSTATTAAAAASFSLQASAGDFQQITAKIMASLRADLLKQQIKPTAATAADAGVSGTTGPVVEVDVACHSVNATLTTLESRLVRYHALEQRLTAASDLDHVELNVGGERFHTTVATLCKEPSYLQGLFSGCVLCEYLII